MSVQQGTTLTITVVIQPTHEQCSTCLARQQAAVQLQNVFNNFCNVYCNRDGYIIIPAIKRGSRFLNVPFTKQEIFKIITNWAMPINVSVEMLMRYLKKCMFWVAGVKGFQSYEEIENAKIRRKILDVKKHILSTTFNFLDLPEKYR